jgi:hypothetical protein
VNPADKKKQRLQEVSVILEDFSKQHLSDELAGYVHKLWEMIGRKRNYTVTGGKKEIWAAAVVYVIARLNFLFDRSSPDYLPPDKICAFFDVKKTTVGARATEIEKACNIHMGHEGLCREEISDSLSFVELPNGMVLPKSMAKQMGIIVVKKHES